MLQGHQGGLALSQGASFIEHHRLPPCGGLQGRNVHEQHPVTTRPTPTVIAVGVASASASGQAIMMVDTAAVRAKSGCDRERASCWLLQ